MPQDFVYIPLVAIGVVAFLAISVAWISGWMDRSRIRGYLAQTGGELLDTFWVPFGPGWFGGENATIYEIRYLDAQDHVHHAYCRTSMMSGVYFTEDEIVEYSPTAPKTMAALTAENAQLRREVEMLRRKVQA